MAWRSEISQTKIRPNVILPYTFSYQRFVLHQSLKLCWLQYFSQNHKCSKELEKTLPVGSLLSVSQHVGTNFMHHHVFSCISYKSYSSHGTTHTVIQQPKNAGAVNGHNTSSPNMSIGMNLTYWSITTKIRDYEFWRTKRMAEAKPIPIRPSCYGSNLQKNMIRNCALLLAVD